MHWQLKTRASVLATGLLFALSSTARADAHRTEEATSGSAETTTTTTTMTAVPADTPPSATTETVTTTTTTVPAPDEWAVFGGRIERGSHTASATLANGYYETMVSYRYGLRHNLSVGLMLAYGTLPYNTYYGPSAGQVGGALAFNPFITLSVLQTKRFDIGVTAAPGLRWFFRSCYNGGCASEQRTIDLTILAAAMYSVVPNVLLMGLGIDLYPEMQIKQNGTGVSFTFPVLAGGMVEYHVTRNFALSAEGKIGVGAGSQFAYNQNQAFFITRYTLGLTFHGMP